MTKLRLIILSVLAVVLYSPISKAQNGVGGTPPSFKYSNDRLRFVQQPFTTPINFKIEDLKKEDAVTNKTGMPLRFAQAINVDLDIKNNGKWSTLEDGQKIWQLPISSPGANGLIISFSEMYIPEGGQLFIYTADKKQVVGAYTHNENRSGKLFDSPVLFQDEVILEYVASTVSTEEPRLRLSDVGYVYNLKTTNSEDLSCMVNINCPEGDNWQLQKNGVLQMTMRFSDGWYYCSASLINNARNDATPYILTADHCIADGLDTITFETVKFQFFRERSGCTTVNSTTPSIQETMIGVELLVDLSIYGKSDGVLLRLKDSIPTDWNVYYNGWDANNIAATSGVTIHHPAGLVKTISTFTEPLVSGRFENYTAKDAHWVVRWDATATAHSVTAKGSSGSPIFNQDGLIVGTLTGGNSYCSQTGDGEDYYGKMSYHWNNSNGAKQIKNYLDPDNTGILKLEGYNPHTANSSLNNVKFETSRVSVIAFFDQKSNELTINAKDIIENISVYNLSGRLMTKIENVKSSVTNISTSMWTKGVYNIVVNIGGGVYATKVIK